MTATVAQRQRSAVFKNLFSRYSAEIISSILNLAPISFLPSYLGPTGMGQLALALSFTAIFGTLIVLGTEAFIVREIARDRQRLSEIVSSALVLRVVLALVFLPLTALTVWGLDYPWETTRVVLLMYGVIAIRIVGYSFSAALQALEVMTWSSAAIVAKKVVAVVLGLLVLYQGGGLTGYILVLAVGEAVELVINLFYFIDVAPVSFAPRLPVARQIIRGGTPFLLWIFLQQVGGQSGDLILSRLGSLEAVGWLAVAAQFVVPLFAIPTVAVAVLLPQLSHISTLDGMIFRRAVARALNYMLIITVPLALGLAAVADRVIGLFNYPAAFQHSVPVLQLLAVNLPGTSLLIVMACAVTAMKQEKSWTKVSLFTLTVTIVFNVVCIRVSQSWWNNPAIGAALATCTTELATLLVALWLFGHAVADRSVFVTLCKTLLAGLVMALVVLIAKAIPLGFVIMLGGMVYTGAILLLRVVPPSDLAAIQTLLLRHTRQSMTTARMRLSRHK